MGCQKYGESTERGLGRSGVKFYHVRMILGKTHSPPAAFHFSEPRLLPGSRRRAGSEFPKFLQLGSLALSGMVSS